MSQKFTRALGVAAITAAFGLTAALSASHVSAATKRAKQNPLRISVYALGEGKVEVIVTNTGRKTVRMPKWQLPSAAADSNVFTVLRDGQPVRFQGRMIKRSVPTAAEFAILRPGAQHRAVVDLRSVYDLGKAGHYTVTFNTHLQYASLTGRVKLTEKNGQPMIAQGAPVQMALDVQAAAGGPRVKPILPMNPVLSDVIGITTTNCNATQIPQVNKAILSARSMSENAKTYLNGGTSGARYTTWFGAYTSTRYATAQQHFVAIDSAMDQTGNQITINCGCTENYYAYVYPTQPYQIWVCNAFWGAPLIGTDSKAGTLIHEMSHFNAVAGTDDHVYGQTGARNLANTNPTNALDNADNHEYFAENTPAQN